MCNQKMNVMIVVMMMCSLMSLMLNDILFCLICVCMMFSRFEYVRQISMVIMRLIVWLWCGFWYESGMLSIIRLIVISGSFVCYVNFVRLLCVGLCNRLGVGVLLVVCMLVMGLFVIFMLQCLNFMILKFGWLGVLLQWWLFLRMMK